MFHFLVALKRIPSKPQNGEFRVNITVLLKLFKVVVQISKHAIQHVQHQLPPQLLEPQLPEQAQLPEQQQEQEDYEYDKK